MFDPALRGEITTNYDAQRRPKAPALPGLRRAAPAAPPGPLPPELMGALVDALASRASPTSAPPGLWQRIEKILGHPDAMALAAGSIPPSAIGGDPQQQLDQLALAMAPIPLLGTGTSLAADGYRYATDPDSRTWRYAGLTAAGLVPFGGILKGVRPLGRMSDELLSRIAKVVPEQAAADFRAVPREITTNQALYESLLRVRPSEADRIWERLPDLVQNPQFVVKNYQPDRLHRPLLVSTVAGKNGLDAVALEADVLSGRLHIPTAMYGPPRTILRAEPLTMDFVKALMKERP